MLGKRIILAGVVALISLPAQARHHVHHRKPVVVSSFPNWSPWGPHPPRTEAAAVPAGSAPQPHARRHHHVVRRRHSEPDTTYAGGGRLAGFPQALVSKVTAIVADCGSRIVSAFRPGARVAGSGHLSNHARKKAVDMAGNPSCIYAHLKGWPGGYSTDYAAVKHVHISYCREHEWGARFAHYGHGQHYAHRHHRRTHYARA